MFNVDIKLKTLIGINMDQQKNRNFVNEFWDEKIIPTLMEYIKIPNKSPAFDPDWRQHGYMQQAVKLIVDWCQLHALKNMTIDVIEIDNRTPVIFIDIAGNNQETILLYGHLDKQPEMAGWAADLSPWKPVLKNDKLYGRGAADDGYAVFAALTAIKSLHAQKIAHARCIILIEACEESGSFDLPFYIDKLKSRINHPSLVICLDSGCGNYEQLWLTTSLRGMLGGILNIKILNEGVHSGLGSGMIPSCFRILRLLLSRIENETTGDILLQELKVNIPENRQNQIDQAAIILGDSLLAGLPFASNVQPESTSVTELLSRRTWKGALSIIGCDHLPATQNAGNVTLPTLAVKLSVRIPPTCDAKRAMASLKTTLETNPPYHAHIKFEANEAASGWNAPSEQPWLVASVNRASLAYFGKEAAYLGEGGSIPFMGMLAKKFPQAQFMITGVLGPHSNAHGPNEFLHIPTAKKLTACVAEVIADQYK